MCRPHVLALIFAAWATRCSGDDASGDKQRCQLVDLFAHSAADADGNAQPIDIHKVEDTSHMYWGQMDYGMHGFDVEAIAVPQDSCRITRTTDSTLMVDAGSHLITEVVLEDLRDTTRQSNVLYRVNISRLMGTETTLRAIKIQDAYLVPGWDARVRNYTAYLDAQKDVVKVAFERLDNGQVVSLVSEPEEPSTEERRLQASGRPVSNELSPPVGESQYLPSMFTTTVDVGRQRLVDLVVNSADQSAIARYSFTVKRPWCPQERRFFDATSESCTDICNEGYFGNPETGRCTTCIELNCAVCDSGSDCSLCLTGFSLSGGKCTAIVASAGIGSIEQVGESVAMYESSHRFVVVGSAGAATTCIAACIFLLCCVRGHERRRTARLIESDDDEFTARAEY
eukprot:gnl/TRDRNA2_/TRDRNA2_80306_c0_seq1.p1 gnl/TRDRNA2_/TRDRNA2_80306_c0~~gnl/TRDRNA2_/TRDRNA2_80306_c0_seq1.p1  ORF type:complete len:398 (+),score=52.44 gnl/TRDRNA2_/TRDRNA2_80306_c0_seq1:46-1239(+)